MIKNTGMVALALSVLIGTTVARAEDSTTTAAPAAESAPAQTVGTAAAPAQSDSKLYGMLDARPSWTLNSGQWITDNVAELGYQFNKNTFLSYWQEFTTNLYNDKGPPSAQGLNFTLGRGVVRTRVNRLYESSDKTFQISYENRTYLPTGSADQAAGMIAISRNYFKFIKKLSDSVSLLVYEIPIPHIYSRSGTGASANTAFQNRVYVMASVDITPKLNFIMPVMFHQTLSRDHVTSGSWNFTLWVYPELDWAVTENLTLGVAYYSDNLIKADLSGFTLGEGISKGVFQFVTILSI